MNKITVKKSTVKPILDLAFPDWKGRKVSVLFVDFVTLCNLNWDGGSIRRYAKVDTSGQAFKPVQVAPWENKSEGVKVPTGADYVIVCHDTFQGEDMGVVIYAHPSIRGQAARLLKA